jgi:N-acylglucosamine-6-phosphate 2-epimerase
MIETLRQGLIVSCQAPTDSPLHDPVVIAAMAQASINQGAVGIRVDTPAHVKAVRAQVGQAIPIIGLWKQQLTGYEVYITPLFEHATEIATAGADIIAIDATLRNRPEPVRELISRIHDELGKLVMADIDTLEAAKAAEAAGADVVGTTLYGYTKATENLSPPAFEILPQMVEQLQSFVICEGGINTPAMAKQALDLGADAVVVGTAITGIDLQVQAYVKEIGNR